MKITFIMITAIGSVIMVPIDNTKKTASFNVKGINFLQNAEKTDIWDGKAPSSLEEPKIPSREVITKTDTELNQTVITNDNQVANTFNMEPGTPATSTANQNLSLDELASLSLNQELYTESCKVPIAEESVEESIAESKSACDNLREKRNIIWFDTAHAVSHYKVSEDYPELHQGNHHVISKDYPAPNLVRVTVHEQF